MDKKTTIKIIREMIVQMKFFESLPKSRKKDDKKWSEGAIFGMKYFILLVSKMMKDPAKEKAYKKLVEWDKEEEKLMSLTKSPKEW